MNSCVTWRLNSMLWERCLAMAFILRKPSYQVKRRVRAPGLDRPIGWCELSHGPIHDRANRSDLREFKCQRTRRAGGPCRTRQYRPHLRRFAGTPTEFGLQTESGYPHKGKLDYVAPTVDL